MAKIKLTAEKVRNIKRRIDKGDTCAQIARDYGVSGGHIRKIKAGMRDPNNPQGRWVWVALNKEDDDLNWM